MHGLDMPDQVAFERGPEIAMRTLEGFFAGVRANVPIEVGALGESFATEFAHHSGSGARVKIHQILVTVVVHETLLQHTTDDVRSFSWPSFYSRRIYLLFNNCNLETVPTNASELKNDQTTTRKTSMIKISSQNYNSLTNQNHERTNQ